MHSGTLINDLFALVEQANAEAATGERERAHADSHHPGSGARQPQARVHHSGRESSEAE
jgi:hypothetical protein